MIQRCSARATVFEGDEKMRTRCIGYDGHDGQHVGDWADRPAAPRWEGDYEVIVRAAEHAR